tara:strand:+ start:6224 stop:8770 length:2547 start_codon:yes stop_codon:yes gene_type:complete
MGNTSGGDHDFLGIEEQLSASIQSVLGIENFYPPQRQGIEKGLTGKNLLLAIPTASGKSAVAFVCMFNRILQNKGMKGIYIVPLKALASEKYEEIEALCSELGLKSSLAVGDRGQESGSLHDWDILVCTSERLDSIIRSRPNFLEGVGCITVDEFHLMDDHTRGPTLEILIARIRHEVPQCQIIALSATVGNSIEVSKWLGANLVSSDWRPVDLKSGTFSDMTLKIHRIDSQNKLSLPNPRKIDGNPNRVLNSLLEDTINEKGQVLIFVNSRASAQKEARELSKYILSRLDPEDKAQQTKISQWNKICLELRDVGEGTFMGRSLADSTSGGIGFHHAGLSPRQRSIIEKSFKNGVLTALVATPTLAQGVNLPSRRVIVRDHRRWNSTAGGSMPVRAMEIRQMIGRAGRPGYDPHGEGIILAKNSNEEQFIVDRYLLGGVEPIVSRLANPYSTVATEDPSLLTHLLALIATGGIQDRYSLGMFLAKTFLGATISKEDLEAKIDRSIVWLFENDMITREGDDEKLTKKIKETEADSLKVENWGDDFPDWVRAAEGIVELETTEVVSDFRRSRSPRKGPAIFGFSKATFVTRHSQDMPESITMTYEATNLGKTISRLYLNPVSGRTLFDGLLQAGRILADLDGIGQISPFSIIHLVTSTPDFQKFWVKTSEITKIESSSEAHDREKLLPLDPSDELERVKSTLIILDWVEEFKMSEMEKHWGVQPGDLRSRVEAANWLLRAASKIVSDCPKGVLADDSISGYISEILNEVKTRVQHGCKADIIPLVSIKGVGRVRAREMIQTLSVESTRDIARMTQGDLEKLSGLQGWSFNLASSIRDEAKRILTDYNGKD